MSDYGPLTEDIMKAAQEVVWMSDPSYTEVAAVLYDWYVQGFVNGYQYGYESLPVDTATEQGVE